MRPSMVKTNHVFENALFQQKLSGIQCLWCCHLMNIESTRRLPTFRPANHLWPGAASPSVGYYYLRRLMLLYIVFQTVTQVSAPRHYSRWLRHLVPSISTILPLLKHTKGSELTSLLLREADSASVASLLLEVYFCLVLVLLSTYSISSRLVQRGC